MPRSTPASFALHEAYPNPFNGSVTISYDLSSFDKNAVLVITDVQGRVVASEKLNSVKGTIHTGSDLGAGIYFAKIESASGNSTPLKINKIQ